MKSSAMQRVYGLLIIVAVIATPFVGFLGPFQGEGTPSTTRAFFLPAGYAFSIWGAIYLGLCLLGLWLLQPPQRDNPRAQRAAPWLALTALFNVVWIVFAGSEETVPWTVPALLIMQVSAWLAYWRLEVHRTPNLPRLERALHVPLQVYVGWLSVATVANTAAALNTLGWNGFGISPVSWTLIMLVAATVVAVVVGWLMGQDNLYRAVFVWAFSAIVVAQADTPWVAWTAGIMAAVVLAVIVYTAFRSRQGTKLARSALTS